MLLASARSGRSLPRLLLLAILLLGACKRGGKTDVRDLPPRSIAAAEDSLNAAVVASTVDGLVVVVTIDGPTVHLDAATPARIPKARSTGGGGDRVKAAGFAKGARLSEVDVPDGVVNTQENVGVVRLTKRQVIIPLPAPRPIDTVEVSAPATGATARLDVRAAYEAYCKATQRNEKFCPN